MPRHHRLYLLFYVVYLCRYIADYFGVRLYFKQVYSSLPGICLAIRPSALSLLAREQIRMAIVVQPAVIMPGPTRQA